MCRYYSPKVGIAGLMVSKNQDVFSTIGCTGNKKALEKFLQHETSQHHMRCIELHGLDINTHQTIQAQLNEKLRKEQEQNRKQLVINFLHAKYFIE